MSGLSQANQSLLKIPASCSAVTSLFSGMSGTWCWPNGLSHRERICQTDTHKACRYHVHREWSQWMEEWATATISARPQIETDFGALPIWHGTMLSSRHVCLRPRISRARLPNKTPLISSIVGCVLVPIRSSCSGIAVGW